MNKTIHVYFNHLDNLVKLGCLFINKEKTSESYSFQFDPEYLLSEYSNLFIDNDLFLYHERQYLSPDKKFYSFISDSTPDRWGRKLLLREESRKAKVDNRKPNKLDEIDFLLGVSDFSRMGCLRYKVEEDGLFLGSNENGIPPLEKIRDIEYASLHYEDDELGSNEEYLRMLLSPGSSLGGARPKATFIDNNNDLWMAKFPSKHDEYDIGKWEMVAFDLAKMCKIDVPEHKIVSYSKYGSTILTKRFDRIKEKRVAFMSAMTALGKDDGDDASSGVSYLDIASFIKANGINVAEQLEELYRRIAFNIAISNTDDHLRNHGFVVDGTHWKLSPAYDLNPTPYGNYLSLLIDQNTNDMNYDALLSTHDQYFLSTDKAKEIIDEINNTVASSWEPLAKKYNIASQSISYMKNAFIKK